MTPSYAIATSAQYDRIVTLPWSARAAEELRALSDGFCDGLVAQEWEYWGSDWRVHLEPPTPIQWALHHGNTVSVPYHIESAGPNQARYSWGAPEVGEANGPDGYLLVGTDDAGQLVIDEWDTTVCPEELHGYPVGNGGHVDIEFDE